MKLASTEKGGLNGLTVQELTEVFRGKKHKVALGLESQKIEGGDILYRLVRWQAKANSRVLFSWNAEIEIVGIAFRFVIWRYVCMCARRARANYLCFMCEVRGFD